MYKKLNYKWLTLLVVILAIILLIVEFAGQKKHSDAYPSVLAAVDTSKLTEFTIAYYDKEDVNLVKENGKWFVLIDDKKINTEKRVVDMMLEPLIYMAPQKVAATKQEDWEKFDLNEEKAIHVWAKEGKKEVANLYIGNFTYTQPTQQEMQADPRLRNQPGIISTYVRLEGRKEVFGVNDFLKLTYDNKEPKHFRNKDIAQIDFNEISSVNFNYPGETFNLVRKDDKWELNGQAVDSANTAQYIRILSNQKGVEFVDDYDIENNKPDFKVLIEGYQFSPILISAFPADSVHQYVVTSSVNPDAKFSGAVSDVFSKIFVRKDHFLKKAE